jgi:hypothetical protein
MDTRARTRLRPAIEAPAEGRVHLVDAGALEWQATADPGVQLKPVRYDASRGHFLGLVQFDPGCRSGLHQHTDVALSFVLDGGLTDYHGSLGLHEAGINLRGATHDAIAYQRTLLVSRLQGPVLYPPERVELTGLHAGSRHAEIPSPAPDVPPEVNVRVDSLPCSQTGVAGITRQTVFDFAGTGHAHRYVQLALRPGAHCPAWRASALTEFWVRGGLLEVDDRVVPANTFVVIEPQATVRLAAPYGALLQAWAEGPESWLDGDPPTDGRAARASLFGF